jgi:hypothetical protein
MSPEQIAPKVDTNSYSGQPQSQVLPPYTQPPIRASFNPVDNFETARMLAAKSHQQLQQQQQQQQHQQQPSPVGIGGSNSGRVINRNYLQIQSNNYNKMQQQQQQQQQSMYASSNLATGNLPITSSTLQDDGKRTESLSRSLRSLFTSRTSSATAKLSPSQKRDKSYESAGQNYDIQSGQFVI